MSKPETQTYYVRNQDDGQVYPIDLPVTLQGPLRDRVIDGHMRAATARAKVASIINRQQAKYPTAEEQGGKAGTPITGPSAAEVKDYSPTQLLGYAASGASDALGQAAGALNRPAVGPMSMEQMKQAPPLENIEGQANTMATGVEHLGSADPRTRAQGAMETITNTLPVVYGAAQGIKGAVGAIKSESAATTLQAKSDVNAERSLKPTTLEMKAVTQRIAPELVKRGILGTGKQIDAKIINGLDDASKTLTTVEDRLTSRPEGQPQIKTAPIVAQLDDAIDKLHVRGEPQVTGGNGLPPDDPQYIPPTVTRVGVTGHPDAVSALNKVRSDINKLPANADLDQIVKLRRQYDKAVSDAGGYKEASSADRVALKVKKGAADLLRGAINSVDPELKQANSEYSFYRSAADVVERRQLGEVGVTDSGLPGRGAILDDIIAGWAGNAVGGPAGAVTAELINLGRQTRGYASLKAAMENRLASSIRPKAPLRLPSALLGSKKP